MSTSTSTESDSEHNTAPASAPLILLPGVGGDARMFSGQHAAFPELILPPWIEPEPREPLTHYAARFATVIDPGQRCFLGGVSFGGVMALELATHLPCYECYLFGSIGSPHELPKRLRFFRSISDLVMIPKWLSPVALTMVGSRTRPIIRHMLLQLSNADARFIRWAAGAILNWKPSPATQQVPVVRIHGDCDWIFPHTRVNADLMVPGAGHLVSMTHSDDVNRFVRERMRKRMAANL